SPVNGHVPNLPHAAWPAGQADLAPGLVPGPANRLLRGSVRGFRRRVGPAGLGDLASGLRLAGVSLPAPPSVPADRPAHLDPVPRLHAGDRPHRLRPATTTHDPAGPVDRGLEPPDAGRRDGE